MLLLLLPPLSFFFSPSLPLSSAAKSSAPFFSPALASLLGTAARSMAQSLLEGSVPWLRET